MHIHICLPDYVISDVFSSTHGQPTTQIQDQIWQEYIENLSFTLFHKITDKLILENLEIN